MFFVFSKEKIKSYLISLGTVVVLLVVSIVYQNSANNILATSSSITKMPILKVEKLEKVVAMSINCVENMDNISSILDTLSKMKAKATFFITGEVAEKYPEEVKKIVDNGNEIGNLSDKYISLKKLGKDDILKQIQECNKKIENITKEEPVLFRTPYGEYNNLIIETAQNENLEVTLWNIDSLDHNELETDEIWEQIEENLSNGSIILTHNEYIDKSLEIIIHNIQEKGYSVTSVSDIIYKANYEIDENGVQRFVSE